MQAMLEKVEQEFEAQQKEKFRGRNSEIRTGVRDAGNGRNSPKGGGRESLRMKEAQSPHSFTEAN